MNKLNFKDETPETGTSYSVNEYWRKRGEDGTRKMVLHVEDDGTMKILAGVHIGHSLPGYEVLQAEDGESALRLLEERKDLAERISLVITDIKMPKVGGVQLAEDLRIHERLKEVPIILHTAAEEYFDPEAKEHAEGQDLIDRGVIQGLANKVGGPMELREKIRGAFNEQINL
jgi:CheY-like chemotaxis protein